MKILGLTRRRTMSGLSAVGLFGVSVGTRVALAQDSDALKVAIAAVNQQYRGLIDETRTRKMPLPVDYVAAISDWDLSLRVEIHAAAKGLTDSEISEVSGQPKLAQLYIDEGIALNPSAAEIVESKLPVTESSKVEECEIKALVVLDVLLESWGMKEASDLIKEGIKALPGFSDQAKKLEEAIGSERLDSIIDIAFDLLRDLVTVDTLGKLFDTFEAELGREKARRLWRKLLARFGMRFLPVIGYLALGVSLVFALHNNWDRLTCQVE